MRSRVWAEGRSLTTASVFLGSHPTAPTTFSEHLQSKENVYEIFWFFFWISCFSESFWKSCLKRLFGQPPDSPHYVLRTSAIKRKFLWDIFKNYFLFKSCFFRFFRKSCLKWVLGSHPTAPNTPSEHLQSKENVCEIWFLIVPSSLKILSWSPVWNNVLENIVATIFLCSHPTAPTTSSEHLQSK